MRIEHRTGSAVALHGRTVDAWREPVAWLLEPSRPALVLGSAQPWSDIDHSAAAEAGLEIGRRRSGGGAVLLWPGGQVWLDVFLPRDDPRWDDRVDVAAHWVGGVWAGVLAASGVVAARVHTGANQPGALGSVVCFAGLGPGEVAIGDAKAVGISQRRTMDGARFQTVAYTDRRGAPEVDDLARIIAPAARRYGRGPAVLAASLLPLPLPLEHTGRLDLAAALADALA